MYDLQNDFLKYLRVSDVITLEWSHVNFEERKLTKQIVKTKNTLRIPLCDEAIDILVKYREENKNPRLGHLSIMATEKVYAKFLDKTLDMAIADKMPFSYERIAKAISQYSSMPKMDIVNFFEIVLFSWITGNNDMHLKNFSMYEPQEGMIRMTPTYDLLNAAILNPKDDEELALTLDGRKKHLKRSDFISAGEIMRIDTKIVDRLIGKYVRLQSEMTEFIGQSFLDDDLKSKYIELVSERIDRING